MSAVYNGSIDKAELILSEPRWEKEKKNILLYYLNKGTVLWMSGKPAESNKFFQLADYYIEDYNRNYGTAAVSLLTNPNAEAYAGEGFEHLLLHYYSALNYIDMGLLDEALIECKRMQQKLTRITDYYKGKNKYKRDAFAHNLMGIIYDAQGDYNNAFIAYRNAYEIYRDDYEPMLKTAIPQQLKKDLIRTARKTGFIDDAEFYEKEFHLTYQPEDTGNGNLVFFWNNGMGPIKEQWSLNFAVLPASNGWVRFYNAELNMSFPFYVGNDKDKSNKLSTLKIVRVAFTKYISRKPLFTSGTLHCDSLNLTGNFEIAEDVNAIAYRSLDDRMASELGEALLRVALKQATEQAFRSKNEGLGAAISIVNAVTEQADTRNWQLLPYSIQYTRLSLPAGTRQVALTATSADGVSKETNLFEFKIMAGKTTVGSFQTLQFNGYSGHVK